LLLYRDSNYKKKYTEEDILYKFFAATGVFENLQMLVESIKAGLIEAQAELVTDLQLKFLPFFDSIEDLDEVLDIIGESQGFFSN
jgi:hypothetical protein